MKLLVAWLLAGFAGAALAADGNRFFPLAIEEAGGKALAGYQADQPWSSVPQGSIEFGGVPFNLVNKVQIHGNGDAKDNRLYPERLIGIRVGRRAARLHLVHGGNMSDRDGRPVVSLHFHYADGSAHTNHLAYGVHFRDWWKHRGERVESLTDARSKRVWTGRSLDADKRGSTHRLFMTTLELPAKAQSLESIDIFSLFSRGSYIVVAMTVESAAPGAPAVARRSQPPADDSKYREEILLRVTDGENNPVPGARIRGAVLDSGDEPIALGQLEVGEEPGVVPVDFPAGARQLRLSVVAPRLGSAELSLVRDEEGRLPREASVVLKPGARIGGIVRAQNGRPLPRAKVEVLGLRRDLAGQVTLSRIDEVTTDREGMWKTETVPRDFADLSFQVTHAEFRPREFELGDDGGDGTVSRAALLGNAAEFTLKPGIPVTGVVRDDAGQPAADVELTLEHGTGLKKTSRALTDAQGRFRFVVFEEGTASFLADASGFAPTARQVPVAEDTPAVELTLTRGRMLKGRVFEVKPPQLANRTPASGVDVVISSYESPLLRWSGRTDAAGRFEWPNAPAEELRVAASREGTEAETATVSSTAKEVEVVLRGALLAWGTVIDAETRQPIPEFTVTPGESRSEDRMAWRSHEAIQGRDGAFSLPSPKDGRYGVPRVIKVEAPGYWPQASPVHDASTSSNLFELRRGSNPKGVAKLPDGKPAAEAEVAIIGEGYLPLAKARFNNARGAATGAVVVRSDVEGRFELPLRLSQRVVIVHADGYGETTLSNLSTQAEVTLQPWGTVEGVVMVGNKPGANTDVKLNETRGAFGLTYEFGVFDMKTDAEGRFRFTHVPPGPRWLVRLIPTHRTSRTWSHQTPVNVAPGKVTQVTVGGTGLAVIGKVSPSDPSREIDWSSGVHFFGTAQPQPFRGGTSEDRRAWANSPEVKAAREASRYYAIAFSKDGSFRIDDVPSGNYDLRLSFIDPSDTSRPGQGKPIGNISRQVQIGPLPNGRSDEPLDLGTLELKVRD